MPGSETESAGTEQHVSAAMAPSVQQAVQAGLDAIEEADAREDTPDRLQAFTQLEERGALGSGFSGTLGAHGLGEVEAAYRQEAVAGGATRRRSRTTPAAPEWLGSVQMFGVQRSSADPYTPGVD